ncbi:MAG: M28 family metallopeptidase [Gammaproteobacteria bacterium]
MSEARGGAPVRFMARLPLAGGLLAAVVAGVAAPATAHGIGADPARLALAERLRAHVEFLADDRLRGRQPGTPGYDIAANYVASVYRQLGLRPAGDDGTFFQAVPLRRAWLEPGSARLAVVRDGKETDFTYLDEFYRGPSLAHEESEVRAGMAFAGYGIDAPALGYNDFDGLDVEGRVVVTLAGQPPSFPSEEGAHFASSREKARAALERGAVGLITVYTPRTEGRYAWDRVRDRVGTSAMGWLTTAGDVFAAPAQVRGGAVVHYGAASVLFEGTGVTMEQLIALDEAGGPLPAQPLKGEVLMAQRSRHEVISSPNVAGVLPGTDPELGAEYVLYIAHLDHLGELAGDGHEDAINNGAMDNASGVAVMLETARRFVEGDTPRRSVLFLAVTAEEKGLVGSEYFARNPTVPVERIAGVINLDMPVLLYEFGDVIAFGAAHSTLGDAARQAAEEAGIRLTPDPFPDQNMFVRSDHYRFVQRGVPSLFLMTGPSSLDGKENTLPVFEGFLAEHYHKPTDDLDLPINYNAAARFTEINTRIGEIVADQRERPAWREGSFFGETFSP